MAIYMILMTGGLACAQSSDFLLPLKHFVVHILHPPTALYQTYVNQFLLARICFLRENAKSHCRPKFCRQYNINIMLRKPKRGAELRYKRKGKRRYSKHQLAAQTDHPDAVMPGGTITIQPTNQEINQATNQATTNQATTPVYEEVEVYSFADALFGDLNDLHEAQNIIVKHLESRRYSIAFLFVHIHNAPPRKTWYDKDGVVTKIKAALCIPTGTCIKKVLEEIMFCCESGIQYAPKMLSGRGLH